MTNSLSNYDHHMDLLASVRPGNKKTLFDALHGAGITKVMVEFDGCGDSGQIEAITAFAGDDTVVLPDITIEIAEASWRSPEITRSRLSIAEAIEHVAYKHTLSRPSPCTPLTTHSLAGDYLILCRNPLKDIHRWVVEAKPKTRSAHAHRSTHHPLAGSFGFRSHALHALPGRMDTPPGERHQDYRLSSRPGTGADQYDQLRSLRAEGPGVGPPPLRAHSEAQGEAVADIGASASELGGIIAYFNSLIAAARNSLSCADAAIVTRSLRIQKILAMRAANDRQRASRANQRKRAPHAAATAPCTKQQLG